MTGEERVKAVVEFGFTERQARFLVTVMLHSGVCLQRQYAAFAGIVHGQKTRIFFEKLVRRGYATAYPCRHNRGRVYHVHHKPLYRAIGDIDSRHRRPMPAARVVENLMTLDALLSTPAVTWLARHEDRQIQLSTVGAMTIDMARMMRCERDSRVKRAARHWLSIGIDPTGCRVFLYVVTDDREDDFHLALQQRAGMLAALPTWTLRIAFPPDLAWLRERYEEHVRQELANPQPGFVSQLRWYFKQRRAHTIERIPIDDPESYDEAQFAFSAPRYRVLFGRWLSEGDTAFDAICSTATADAIKSGAGQVEYHVLPFSYRHLSLLVDSTRPVVRGAEEGEHARTPSRPPLARSIVPCGNPAEHVIQTTA